MMQLDNYKHEVEKTQNLSTLDTLEEKRKEIDSSSLLAIEDLNVSVEGKNILNGVNLRIKKGEIHTLMGPNGSGKSTLAHTLMGHPGYKIESGNIIISGESIIGLSPDERAKKGLFLAFQYPTAIPGVSIANFLRTAINTVKRDEKDKIPISKFRRLLKEKMKMLKMDESFARRCVNDGFSGGEKKRAEILQMAMLEPEIAVLDETDSGLDIDALKIVSEGVNALIGPELGILIITHYQRILNYIKPQFVHVLLEGRIVVSGGAELAEKLEKEGYDLIKEKFTTESRNVVHR
ncbi:MAG: chain A of ATP binding cassette transporter [Candidatus Scalindua rubra]|uniref:Chain A of ATP binding cassette transporter n=1 Tax=Candidatus Scalindua rubra TaxID=1872076 RepID=A0A1E3X3P4_9BACT|nr:MAG: chain A of ATP binding cassette transporter [Candidatus Scalindua rubra]